MQRAAAGAGTEWGDLLSAVAEQLKVPLTIISRQAELSQMSGTNRIADIEMIRTQADAALQLVDSYLLGLELFRGQMQLEMEPVSVSSSLIDTAHTLERFARDYNIAIEVAVGGRYEPVMAHGRGLRAALLSLGYGLVEAVSANATDLGRQQRIQLATHKTARGIVTGVYGMGGELQSAKWRNALQLIGRARQPLTGLSTGTSAGLFVADTIFRGMASCLRVGVWQHERGLAAVLQPSKQLQLV